MVLTKDPRIEQTDKERNVEDGTNWKIFQYMETKLRERSDNCNIVDEV